MATMLQVSTSIACQNEQVDTTTFLIHYDAITSNPFDEYIQVEVYEYDTINRAWHAIMVLDDESSYLKLERSKAYQIWMHDRNESKVFCIEPGYTGQYEYRLHANLSSELCVLMVPDRESFKMEYMKFDVITPYIFEDEILD